MIDKISPTKVIGGMGEKLTILGHGFGDQQGTNYVSFKTLAGNYMNPLESLNLQYDLWENIKIIVEVPISFSGKVLVHINGVDNESVDELKVNVNLWSIKNKPLDYCFFVNQNGKGGYTWHIHRDLWNNLDAKIAIESVFQEFRYKTGANFILEDSPSDATFNDPVSLIALDPLLTVPGFCGETHYAWTINGVSFTYFQFHHIHLSDKLKWYYGRGKTPPDYAKFRYVLMHELGHAHGLHHVNEPGQTMVEMVIPESMVPWSSRDSITPDERFAISHLVELSQNFTFRECGITPMTKITDPLDIYG